MRKIIAGTFVTLDGVMEAPGSGDPTLPQHRGWSEPFMSDEVGALIFEQMQTSDALLLGRKTYQDFAAFWPFVPEDDPFGKRMNSVAKYVVSTTLEATEWNNSYLIHENVIEQLFRLKGQEGQNIQITGSGDLINSLLQHDLIDEFQLMVCPVVLGTGKYLFNAGNAPKSLKLVNARCFDSGMVLLTYASASKT
jgi:dihydrofolate reductase